MLFVVDANEIRKACAYVCTESASNYIPKRHTHTERERENRLSAVNLFKSVCTVNSTHIGTQSISIERQIFKEIITMHFLNSFFLKTLSVLNFCCISFFVEFLLYLHFWRNFDANFWVKINILFILKKEITENSNN